MGWLEKKKGYRQCGGDSRKGGGAGAPIRRKVGWGGGGRKRGPCARGVGVRSMKWGSVHRDRPPRLSRDRGRESVRDHRCPSRPGGEAKGVGSGEGSIRLAASQQRRRARVRLRLRPSRHQGRVQRRLGPAGRIDLAASVPVRRGGRQQRQPGTARADDEGRVGERGGGTWTARFVRLGHRQPLQPGRPVHGVRLGQVGQDRRGGRAGRRRRLRAAPARTRPCSAATPAAPPARPPPPPPPPPPAPCRPTPPRQCHSGRRPGRRR